MAWKWFIPLFLASCIDITYCDDDYDYDEDDNFAVEIVFATVGTVVTLSILIAMCICFNCGLCKRRGSVGAGGVVQSNTLQTTVVPPPGQQYGQSGQQYGQSGQQYGQFGQQYGLSGQQYGQSGVSSFGQTQYGAPPSFGQPMQYGQQQYGFGQPVGNQFSYGRP